MGTIALLTDFGPDSPYVGAMKGVIARAAGRHEAIDVIDLAHDLPPQAVDQAGFVLRHSYRYFPRETVFCCVVDPGVGTERAIVAAQTSDYAFVAPAGALLADVLACEPGIRTVEVTRRDLFLEPLSSTFHGRDAFAPIAAHLARGHAIETLGPTRAVERLITHNDAPLPGQGRVRLIDRFGNLVTDLVPPWPWLETAELRVGSHAITRAARTFGEAPGDGSPFFYFGSYGTIEVAVREGNAAERLGVERGEAVIATRRERAHTPSDHTHSAMKEAAEQP